MFVEYKYKYNYKYKYKYTNAITNTNRYMFVEYESHRAAALARKKLVQGSVFLFGQEIGQVLINGMNKKIKEIGQVLINGVNKKIKEIRHVQSKLIKGMNGKTKLQT